MRRLKVACAMEDTAPGPYLARLIDAAARRWVVQDRPGTNRRDAENAENSSGDEGEEEGGRERNRIDAP
jgi:hypothetical protein